MRSFLEFYASTYRCQISSSSIPAHGVRCLAGICHYSYICQISGAEADAGRIHFVDRRKRDRRRQYSCDLGDPVGTLGVTVDAPGNVYIADFVDNRIRMVNPSGTIGTFVGNGTFALPKEAVWQKP
jgi:hypothetical protein